MTANASPVVVRLTMEASLVVAKADLMTAGMTTVARDWTSELSRR